MQEVWLRSSLWLHGGYRHIHRRRHIEISICVSFDYLLPQAYWGFFVLETEVIDMDRKKKKKSSSESATLMLLYKSKVTSSKIYWSWRTRHESMLSSAARREERLAPPWEELKSVGCSNGRLLTTPTLPGRHHLPAVRKQLPSWWPS